MGNHWLGKAGLGVLMAPMCNCAQTFVFWALPIAPGKVDPVGERRGAGEGHEPPSPSHAHLCAERRRLRESPSTRPPARCSGTHRKGLVSIREKREHF